jgi:hypothetical protein
MWDALSLLLSNFASECDIKRVQEKKDGTEIEWDTSPSG